ncbi:MAG: SEC-C metal-binding domain-containing protein [Phycisphaeraceae bacterium]
MDTLPWHLLSERSDPPPLDAVRLIANAAVADPRIIDEVIRRLDAFFADPATSYAAKTFEPVTLPAVIAHAGPRLPPLVRQRIAQWAVAKLDTDAYNNNDSQCEIWLEVFPTLLPDFAEVAATHIEHLADHNSDPLHNTGWIYLWNILAQVKPDADPLLRRRITELAERLIRLTLDGHYGDRIESDDLEDAMWVLTLHAPDRMRPLMQPLRNCLARYDSWTRRPHEGHLHDIKRILAGHPMPDYAPIHDKPQPIEKWFNHQWKFLANWYDQPDDEDDDSDDSDDFNDFDDPDEIDATDFLLPPLHHDPSDITWPIERDAPRVGRNDPCPCGSGKKYKKCCGQ